MAIKKLSIEGLRAFSKKVDIEFSIPDGETKGSGLTVLVGPNNSGKSTIMEAVHVLTSNIEIIPKSCRNLNLYGKMEIQIDDTRNNNYALKIPENDGAFVKRFYNNQELEYQGNNWQNELNIFILNSKRSFSSTFNSNMYQDRNNYHGNVYNQDYRGENNNINSNFGGRLLEICKKKRGLFDITLQKVLFPLPKWTIESQSNGNSYLEFSFGNVKHSSNGSGDGFINIFNIIDALYDSREDNVIFIDEPEVSLHPDLQRRLFKLLIEYSKDKQIIISTHSPYFVDWEMFSNKAKVMRVKKVNDEEIKIYTLSNKSKESIKRFLNDFNNPHSLSLLSNEVFFLNDNIILTEGQDDVQCYKKLFSEYNFSSIFSFFGWGVGGASKVQPILSILKDLGYEKIFTILDNDKRYMINELSKMYPNYAFYAIKADDVRNKVDKKMNNLVLKVKSECFDSDLVNSFKDNIVKFVNNEENRNNLLNLFDDFNESSKNSVLEFLSDNAKNVEGLVLNLDTYEINSKYREDLDLLIDSIESYFVEENNLNFEEKLSVPILDEEELNLQEAQSFLDSYLQSIYHDRYIETHFKKFKFNSGGGGIISFKKFDENKFYAIVEESASIARDYSITVNFHYILNTKKKKIKLKKRITMFNSLPVGVLKKAQIKLLDFFKI